MCYHQVDLDMWLRINDAPTNSNKWIEAWLNWDVYDTKLCSLNCECMSVKQHFMRHVWLYFDSRNSDTVHDECWPQSSNHDCGKFFTMSKLWGRLADLSSATACPSRVQEKGEDILQWKNASCATLTMSRLCMFASHDDSFRTWHVSSIQASEGKWIIKALSFKSRFSHLLLVTVCVHLIWCFDIDKNSQVLPVDRLFFLRLPVFKDQSKRNGRHANPNLTTACAYKHMMESGRCHMTNFAISTSSSRTWRQQ